MDELFRSYLLLEIRPGASRDEIKKAYRRLAREWHPDRTNDSALRRIAEAKLREINAAFELLESTPDALRPRPRQEPNEPASNPAYDLYSWRESIAEQAVSTSSETDESFYARALDLHFDGIAHHRAGRWRDAVSCLSQTVFMVRNNPEAWLILGRCYRRLNLPQKSESAYREAIRIAPQSVDARFELGESLLAMGDLAGVRREAESLAEIDEALARDLLATCEQ